MQQSNATLQTAKPFLKWAGGKQQLLAQFEPLFPKKITRYLEPFWGGSAVYFHLWNSQRITQQAFLSDTNAELVNAYTVVRDHLDELIVLLANHEKQHSREYYYAVRAQDRSAVDLNKIERAARTIYLNRTCYNGLYRVNSKGHFNVPIGSYKAPRVLFAETLQAASVALQQACLQVQPFEAVCTLAQAGDFIYFDPPYDPLSKTASFTAYSANNFRNEDQERLAAVFKELSQRGCRCMLSNSHTPFILELYRDFRIEIVKASRAINSQGHGRGQINEVVVLNY